MQSYDYVVIGGGLAGGRGAEGIRQVDEKSSVVLVTQEPHRPYERPPLSKDYMVGEAGLDRVYLQEDGYYEENDIELLTGVRVTRIDPEAQTVTLDDDGVLGYGKLLLATGGRARGLPIPGSDLENVFTLRTIEDSQAIQEAGGEGKHALIMGGSFIGSEVASSLTQRGAEVTMIFPESGILGYIVSKGLSEFLTEVYQQKNVTVLPEVICETLEGDGNVERAVLSNGQSLDVDLVVMGVGIVLNTELAQEAGLELGEDEAVIVDEHLRSSDPNIYCAGDIAAWPDPTFGERLRVEHWDVARRQGRRAGRNMAGEEEAYNALPYFFSDMFDLSFEVWGNLASWERTVERGSLEERSVVYYYFDEGKMVGVFAMGRPSEERSPMQELVKARVAYDEVADVLRDEGVELETLLGGAEEEAADEEGTELSFEEDIRPLFREKDVEEMKEIADFDLSNYEDVRENAEAIHSYVADGSMPCDGPWPEEQVEKFKRWMNQGMKA